MAVKALLPISDSPADKPEQSDGTSREESRY
jgi:hypothetical protein